MRLTWFEDGVEHALDDVAFEERVNRAVSVLRNLGVQPGLRIGVVAGASPLHVVLHAAARRLALAICPLDLRGPDDRLIQQWELLGVELVVAEAGLASRLAAWPGPLVVANADGTDLQQVRGTLMAPRHPGHDTAVIVQTSGTTGTPHAVHLSRDALRRHGQAAHRRLGSGPDSVWLAVLPLVHVGGVALVRRCLDGGHLVLHARFETTRVGDALERHGVTHVSLVPTMLHRLLEAEVRPPPALRCALVGGDRLAPELAARALTAGWPVYATYGLTEACSQVATATPEQLRQRPGTSGKPLDGVQVTILGETGRAWGSEEGEIVVSGPTVAGGSCRTGDWGWLEDGYLYVTGRRLDRIVSGGENVDPAEVEAVLGQHDAISDAAVVGVDDPEWGSRVTAVLVPAAAPPTQEELAAWCEQRLAPHQRPRAFLFTDQLPRTDSGKLQRSVVRRFAAENL